MPNYISTDVLPLIKEDLKKIRSKSENITVSLNGTKRFSKTYKAKITGIYNNFLCVTSVINNYEESFTITYPDLISGRITIKEIDELLEQKIEHKDEE